MNLGTKFNIGDTALYPDGATLKKVKIKTIKITLTKSKIRVHYYDVTDEDIHDWNYGYPEDSLFRDIDEVRREIGIRK